MRGVGGDLEIEREKSELAEGVRETQHEVLRIS
jgi:hypothetical protein